MYKNIKKIRYQRKQKRLQILYTHTHTQKQRKTTEIVVLCSSLKKIEMLKENSYLFTNRIHKKERQIMFN